MVWPPIERCRCAESAVAAALCRRSPSRADKFPEPLTTNANNYTNTPSFDENENPEDDCNSVTAMLGPDIIRPDEFPGHVQGAVKITQPGGANESLAANRRAR
jgi:hypothetical protein